ncbi:hypothetical protein JCM19301_194 [Jejuia pallidilutea]|uniref:Uncharacterized protein n=1 Tax=Jejuia pallidilutea TaxID=504487 RepID=A0A090VYC7_9FLAO|nr:hypothetical protein JCM19301_194 [Jejuia pallidilutea]GAL73299.1 hypothetical protein JCM19302_3686 [Jejuia pallidilutea]
MEYGYEWLRVLAVNFASTHRTENPRGFSEVGENKQLLIAIVVTSFFNNINNLFQVHN